MDNTLYDDWHRTNGRRWADRMPIAADVDEALEGWRMRAEVTKTKSWAVPDDEAIRILVKYSPLIEIGAGLGYWAALIEDAGGDIRAYDRAPVWTSIRNNHIRLTPETMGGYTRVWVGGPEKLRCKVNEGRTLFLCWPPYSSPMAANCLVHLPARVIYVGEGPGGCNADDRFFELLEGYYTLTFAHVIPQWEGIHDELYVYERKT